MSLRSEMMAHMRANPSKEPEELADSFLVTYGPDDLIPLLADEFIHLARVDVRQLEVLVLTGSAGNGSGRPPRTRASIRAELGDLALILNENYRIGDGLARKARDMTLDEWEARKVMLVAQANGIQRSIEVCNRAIEAIRSAGVRCLGDLEDESEAA